MIACNEALRPGRLEGADRALGLYNRGRARQAMGEKANAEADFRGAAAQYTATLSSRNPKPDILYGRAVALHALGDVEKALADYDQAARLDPLDPMIFLNRGILLAHGKKDRYLALVDFERVLALEPQSSRIMRRAEQERAALVRGLDAPPLPGRGESEPEAR